jgi:serine/arginine repetitive matrix protein 2
MREPSPDVEPAANDQSITVAPPVDDQALEDSAVAAQDSVSQEPIITTAEDSVAEAEPDQSQAHSIAPEVLVPETVIPPPKPTSATSGSSKGKSTKSKRKIEVPCTICLRTPWHIQKDCPEVKAGSANLRYLLTARQDQHASISTEDDESHFDSSIEAIQEWIERLEMIAGKVNGVKKDGFKARSPVKVMGNKEGLRLDLNAVEPKKGRRKSAAVTEPDGVNGTSQVAETIAAPATTTTTPTTTLDTAPVPESDSTAQSPPESRPESPMAVPDTYNFPPIHLRAMQKSRRPGSLSGLSVSDAIIETEPSDDSSSDDEDDGLDSDTSSVVSDSTDSDSDSDSDSDGSDSGSSRVVMPADPSDAMKFSLTRDLSEREKKKARLSAAKMQPVTFDLESVVDDGEPDNLEASPSPIKAASRSMARTGSDSSIGDFGDGDSRRSSIDSAATAPYRSQAPPVIASSALPRSPSIASDLESIEDPPEPTPNDNGPTDDDEINENTPSAVVPAEEAVEESEAEAEAPVEISSGQRSRSFRELDGMAASSPDLDDSAGLEAVQQGIDEEDDNVSVNANGDSQTVSSNPVATQSLSQARRTRSSASVVPDDNVIVPASQPLRRSSRTSISATPQDLPRRLRSVSRDIVERTPPPPARSTRSRSQSQVPMSPSTPKARRASRTLISDVEAEEETPKQVCPLPLLTTLAD